MNTDPLTSGELYRAIGGDGAIERVVDALYDRLTNDPIVRHQFDPDRLESLKAGQRAWFAAALTGAPLPVDLRTVHAGLDITDAQVTAVLAHLDEVLTDIGVTSRSHGAVMGVVARIWHARNF